MTFKDLWHLIDHFMVTGMGKSIRIALLYYILVNTNPPLSHILFYYIFNVIAGRRNPNPEINKKDCSFYVSRKVSTDYSIHGVRIMQNTIKILDSFSERICLHWQALCFSKRRVSFK